VNCLDAATGGIGTGGSSGADAAADVNLAIDEFTLADVVDSAALAPAFCTLVLASLLTEDCACVTGGAEPSLRFDSTAPGL
jgi:hypothetical protein